jgi:hypothetical protein
VFHRAGAVVYISIYVHMLSRRIPTTAILHACRTIKRLKPTRPSQCTHAFLGWLIRDIYHPDSAHAYMPSPRSISAVQRSCMYYICIVVSVHASPPTLLCSPGHPRCDATHVSTCLDLSLAAASTQGCLLACYLTSSPQQPHLTSLALLPARRRQSTRPPTPALMRDAYIRQGQPVCISPSHYPPRPQYRVAAQYSTAAGRLHATSAARGST